MTTLTLQRNVQFLYEEQLARLELHALGCDEFDRDADNPWVLRAHMNGTGEALRIRSAYVGTIDETPTIYSQLIRPAYQGGQFNRTRSVNQYLTHWIYPYRGKFHPQMVRALLNMLGVSQGMLVLEPYAGSGTAAFESSLLGADCIALDLSPLCVMLTRMKVEAVQAVESIRERVGLLIVGGLPHPDDLDLGSESDSRVADFLNVARMVTYSDSGRRGRDAAVWFKRNLLAMLESVEAHAAALRHFNLTPGQVTAEIGDSRHLDAAGVHANSVDAIVTSPPYSIALDYVKNDEHALDALRVDLDGLRTQMTGVRGRNAKEKLALYNADMQATFREVYRVLKPGGRAAFVVGDATVDRREVTTTATMAEWAVDAGLQLERNIPKIVFGLYNVMQDERILIFRKP